MNINNPVKLSDGSTIDRSQVAFSLREYKPDKNYLFDSASRVYHKDKNGTLRRLKGKALDEFMKMFLEESARLKEDEIPEQVRDEE